MYTEEEKELVLDRIDKMTLKDKQFTEAFLMINKNAFHSCYVIEYKR